MTEQVFYKPEKAIPIEGGGIEYIYWNEQACGGAGCYEIHEATAADVVKCFEACGAADFFDELTGYLWAAMQSSWCDASCGDAYDAVEGRYLSPEGYTMNGPEDAAEAATALYRLACEALEKDPKTA